MLTVPLLYWSFIVSVYFKQTVNIFSEIGLIMLIGLVTKMDFNSRICKSEKRAGLKIIDAVKDPL